MSKANSVLQLVRNLALWKHFEKQAKKKQIDLVSSALAYTVPLLERYTKAFPIYTLHNQTHVQNIIKLMGELLGNDLKKLSALECAILLLSAAFHDIGMTFNASEFANITKEEEFKIFLDLTPEAKLKFEKNNKVATKDLIEWYCRYAHAKRVWIFLHAFDKNTSLSWKNLPFLNQLGFVCESHIEGVEYIRNNDSKFDTNFLGKCDLIFCCIILRLADILDFDSSRSPKSVYDFLEIDKPKNQAESISRDEWNKHLNSKGFELIKLKSKVSLSFSSSPPHPYIEVGIRKYIKNVNNELDACNWLLKFTSDRWKSFTLPDKVDTRNILSKNYKSGNYHFSLSEDKILNLLTGDNLYNDDFIFLRELIQNAIDTSRYREFIERLTDSSFKAEPILVSMFVDLEGYKWIQVEDFGMGMDEDIINNNLLKKGESFYNSPRFELDKIKIKDKSNRDFFPISRFGIGLLSCFMAGDKIEINTRPLNEHPNVEGFRLTVEGRNSFFVFQSKNEKHVPSKMPSKYSDSPSYRNYTGTTIAVRIKTSKEYEGFDLNKYLEDFIICSPIPIKYNGSFIGGDFDSILKQHWIKRHTIKIDQIFVERAELFFDLKFRNGIDLELIPIDITSNSGDPNLQGQLLIIKINIIEPPESLDLNVNRLVLESYPEKIRLVCIKRINTDKGTSEERIEHILDDIYPFINVPDKFKTNKPWIYDFNQIFLSHNGISIKDKSERFLLNDHYLNSKITQYHRSSTILYSGIIYFQDYFLPELKVSRDEIKRLNFKIVGNLLYSMRELNSHLSDDAINYLFFDKLEFNNELYTVSEIKESNLYESKISFWDSSLLVRTLTGNKLINELKTITEPISLQALSLRGIYNSFYFMLIKYILDSNFETSIVLNKSSNHFEINLVKAAVSFSEAQLEYPPLTFVTFIDSNKIYNLGYINKNHRLIIWYFKNFKRLKEDYFYYSRQLISGLFNENIAPGNSIERLNHILDRLRTLLTAEERPSEDLNLTADDFIQRP